MEVKDRLTVKQFLGEEECRQYAYAYPIFRLLLERIAGRIDDKSQLHWLLFANNGPTLDEYESPGIILKYLCRLPAYLTDRLLNKSRVTDKILVSDTLLMSDRYSYYQQECLKDERITGLSLLYNHYGLKGRIGKKYNRCVNLGSYVVGPDIIKQIYTVHRLIKAAYETRRVCTEIPGYMDEVRRLNDLLADRVDVIKRELVRKGIRQYVTCNQYRVEEIVIIEACRELGIVTKEWSHHSMCTFDIHLYETPADSFISDLENLYIYTDYYFCWSEGDAKWIRKYGNVEPIFDQEIEFPVAGSPEIHGDMAVTDGISEDDSKKDCLCYLVITRYLDHRNDAEICDAHHRILEEIHKLAIKENLKVLVRYHPAQLFMMLDGDMELYEKFGFEVLDTTRESLLKMYADSKLCISCGTSGLVMAYNYGVKTYSVIIPPRGEFDFEGTGIDEVSIEGISELKISDEHMPLFPDAMKLDELYKVKEEM